ncbi:bifunctional protein-serine/threonine kinase/phosphatase [Shewanella cyperi]|uniref:non-specific serine/threonine protein kinase n=1 Tax=Shewanella cyperi TaxID=2814292 RepID=A0A974XQ71_9GAMM|nr:bifunctional protein-serine/threonine kinase/phosphatase [Shewanella cyperi]QSX31373.1 bifunctional protein-serine/threonine kinase/phosphatase [Shewanella cyperi]
MSAVAENLSAAEQMDLPLGHAPSVIAGAFSCAGRKVENEDALGVRLPPEGLGATKGVAAVIADGVSAAEGGGEAARVAVSAFLGDYYSTPQSWGVETAAQKVIGAINHWLLGRGRDYRDAGRGFVCTFSALVLKSRSGFFFHVGDARLYRYRRGQLERLSRDHCVGNRLSGGHFLTRALGLDASLELDHRVLALEEGDLFLLLTDGVHGSLSDRQIIDELQRDRDAALDSETALDSLSETLVQRALANGSGDNLSCLCLRVQQLPAVTRESMFVQLSELPFPPPLVPGQCLDGLRVLRILHESRRSQVYLVQDEASGERFAMKTPSVNFIDDGAYIERFLLESWIGSRLSHPGVIRHFRPKGAQTALYTLSEWCEGLTLTEWAKACRPGFEEKLKVIGRIEQGLRAFHRKDMIHRDLKPDNLLVCADGRVKIIDFGSVLVRGVEEIHSPIEREQVLGTAEYSAPELVLTGRADVRSDLFSLAALAYELFTGESPFAGKLAGCQGQKDYQRLEYIPAQVRCPSLPGWVDRALERALSLDADKRFADSHEFWLALSTPAAVTEGPVPLLKRSPERFYRSLCLAQLLIILLLLLLLLA